MRQPGKASCVVAEHAHLMRVPPNSTPDDRSWSVRSSGAHAASTSPPRRRQSVFHRTLRRSINPHIAPTLEAHRTRAPAAAGAPGDGRLATSAARQPGPTPLPARSERAVSGVSSFAFQASLPPEQTWQAFAERKMTSPAHRRIFEVKWIAGCIRPATNTSTTLNHQLSPNHVNRTCDAWKRWPRTPVLPV